MYLLDTNIWLERLLDQARTAEVEQFLNQICAEQIFITDFTLHSIALALTRRKLFVAFTAFIQDLFIDGTVNLLTLPPSQLIHLPEIIRHQCLKSTL
jgi:predicted nucleic acid-binding protein